MDSGYEPWMFLYVIAGALFSLWVAARMLRQLLHGEHTRRKQR
jgi:hypothetical protein